MGIKAIDLRRGIAVEWNNKLYTVHDFAKVSKGNWRSFMQVKLRDTATGSIIEQRFRVDDELEQAFLDQKAMEYLYSEGDKHHFMNLEDFDQILIRRFRLFASGLSCLWRQPHVDRTIPLLRCHNVVAECF